MDKLIVAGRTNWKGGFYTKFKAEQKSMKIIKKLFEELGCEYFVDNQVIPKTFSNYDKWKDQWIPLNTKDISGDIVCGDKIIHLFISKYKELNEINSTINKYSEWAQPKYKKGFEPTSSS